MRRAYLAADPRADVVELRFDQVRDLRPDRLLGLPGKPKLVTVRSRQQGGGAVPADREPILRKALDAGVEYHDLEFGGRDHLLLKGPGRSRRVLSHHDFQGTPADLQSLHHDMRVAAGDALLKIATFADTAGDILRLRDLLRSAEPGTLAGFCMGPKGSASRVLARLWGSAAVYAPRRVGAVNTVIKVWNRLEGRNTDVEAGLVPLRKRMTLRGARVAVMGAGGAARALVYGLSIEGARVTIFNRTRSRARALARAFGVRHLPWDRLRHFPCDLVINTTSVGLAPDSESSPAPISWIRSPRVYDIIYNPPETRFLREARARGHQVVDGLEMFVEQAAAQFVLFTGREAPRDVMRETALRGPGHEAVAAQPPA